MAVLAVLHEPRFVDLAPAEVYATLLEEGEGVSCSPPHTRHVARRYGTLKD